MTQTPTGIDRLLYSRTEAAQKLSISPRSLAYLIAENRIPTRRIGGRVLIAAKTLRKFASQSDDSPIVPTPKAA